MIVAMLIPATLRLHRYTLSHLRSGFGIINLAHGVAAGDVCHSHGAGRGGVQIGGAGRGRGAMLRGRADVGENFGPRAWL